MKLDKNTLRLYAVTDRSWIGRQTLYEQVESALKGGATCVQLREKNLSEAEFLREALKISALCKRYHTPLFINDNIKIAIQCHADGVHVGQSDMAAARVRRMVGDELLIGVSVHSVAEALEAAQNGADYLGAGAVFSTSTKTDAGLLSLDTLRDICHAVELPVVAIGGIKRRNLSHLAGTGIVGAAIVSGIFSAEDIEKECRLLRDLLEECFQS